MINSRDLNELLPVVKAKAEAFIEACKQNDIDLLVTSTYRDIESQNELYAQGRTKDGKIVTNAKGGESFHNYRCALDVVPLVAGKPDWDGSHPIWKKVAEIGESIGLEWAGNWKSFKEQAHFQFTNGLTLSDLKAGKKIEG
jgi:peptidoglycan L-alanyl-D-glutamate endopeptidase CwlK